MKKIKKVKHYLALVMIFLLVFTAGNFYSVNAQVTEMPKDMKKEEALKQILNTNEMDIFVLDSSKQMKSSFDFKFANELDEIQSDNKYKSIWIAPEYHENFLNKKDYKKLDKFLDKGYTIYFLGLTDFNILNELFVGANVSEEMKGNETTYNLKSAYVSKNKLGEYFIGFILANKELDYSSENVIETMLSSTWNRRNDSNYTRKGANAKGIASLNQKVYASSPADFSIGNSWRVVYSGTQYILNTDYGDYTEWKTAYYLTQAKDGRDYYAMTLEGEMAPGGGNHFSMKLQYKSDADSNGQANLMREHKPNTTPSTYTWSFSLGGSYGTDATSANIGVSWGGTFSDLEFRDNSNGSSQLMDILFDYKEGGITGIPDYLEDTSYQYASFIYQAPTGSSYCKLDNYRNVIFGNLFDITNDSASSYFVTTVYK